MSNVSPLRKRVPTRNPLVNNDDPLDTLENVVAVVSLLKESSFGSEDPLSARAAFGLHLTLDWIGSAVAQAGEEVRAHRVLEQ